MSVLIKGMEMPECCDKCGFGRWSSIHQTAACERHGYDPCFEDYSREHLLKRANFCPLVEVKEPHGNLVDFDKMVEDYWDGALMVIDEQKFKQIESSVIIEAEGREE